MSVKSVKHAIKMLVIEVCAARNTPVGSNPTPSANVYNGFVSFSKIANLQKLDFLLTRF